MLAKKLISKFNRVKPHCILVLLDMLIMEKQHQLQLLQNVYQDRRYNI